MKTFLAALFLVSALALPTLATEPSSTIAVRYDAEHRRFEGTVELGIAPSKATIYMSLLANLDRQPNPYLSARSLDEQYPFGFEPTEMIITQVSLLEDGEMSPIPFRLLALPPSWQTYSLDDTVLAIDLPAHVLEAQAAIALRIEFSTEVPRNTTGDQGITDGVLTWRFGWFPILFPAQDQIVEENGQIAYAGREAFPLTFPWTRLEAVITVPEGLVPIVGADRVERISNAEVEEPEGEDPSAFETFRITYDSPARSLALTLGMDYREYTLDGAIPIEVSYLPGHEEDARFYATLARDILDEYEERFGSYPRSRLTVVENPNNNGLSFAADGIVWLSRRFFTHRNVLFPGALNRVAEFVLAHEIAHQWVGLGTGIDLNTEAWLSEGLAQYLAIRYYEGRYGAFEPNLFAFGPPGLAEEFVKRQFGYFNLREHFIELPYLLTQYAGFDEALVKPTENVQFGNATDVRLYDKGYLVARAIAAAVGEDVFEHTLRRAVDERRADLLDVAALQALLEEESGKPLDEIFAVWVFGSDWADYGVRITSRERTATDHVTTVVATRAGGATQPVEVEAHLVSGATLRQTWSGDTEVGELVFRTPSRVARVTIDPDHRLPDRDRLNNNAPVKIVGGANQAAFPLDAYTLTADTETGGITLSYLDRLRISIAQSTVSAQIKLGRYVQLAAAASGEPGRPTGGIQWTYTAYDQPNTGSPATFWEPDVSWTFGVKRLYAEERPLTAFVIDIADHASFASSRTRALSITMTPSGEGCLAAGASDELRILPDVYIRGALQLGVGFGDPPKPFRFRLTTLHSFSAPAMLHEIVGQLALETPAAGGLPYNVLSLAMIDRTRSRLFIAGGTGWTTPDEFGKTSPCIEAGIEQIVDLSTLGGLLSLQAQFGVSTPVLGRGATVFYARLTL